MWEVYFESRYGIYHKVGVVKTRREAIKLMFYRYEDFNERYGINLEGYLLPRGNEVYETNDTEYRLTYRKVRG